MPTRITGKFLNDLWQIRAEHTLYSHNGTWYHHLERFPGALCDSEGYKLFASGEEFERCAQLRIKQHVGCPPGIRTIPGYIRCDAEIATDIGLPTIAGRVDQRISRIIRDTFLSSELKLLYEHSCQLCERTIPLFGRDYSEAHHIRPLGSPHDGEDARRNLVCVCPNCHVLLDFAAIPLALSSFKILRHHISSESIAYHNELHLKARREFAR